MEPQIADYRDSTTISEHNRKISKVLKNMNDVLAEEIKEGHLSPIDIFGILEALRLNNDSAAKAMSDRVQAAEKGVQPRYG